MAIRTVTICRECTECDGSGEVEIDVDVDGEFESADPDVGINQRGYVVNGAYYAGGKKEIELTPEEEAKAQEQYLEWQITEAARLVEVAKQKEKQLKFEEWLKTQPQ